MKIKYQILEVYLKNTEYYTKISDTKTKYVNTADNNKFTKIIVDNSIKSKNLVDKSDIAGFINNTD